MNLIKYLIYTAFLLIGLSAFAQKVSWEKIKEDENMVLFQKDSVETIKNFKATFKLESSLDEVSAYISNPKNYVEWIDPLDEVSSIKKNDETEYTYFLVDVKPFFQREGIIQSSLAKSDSNDEVTYQIKLDSTYQYPLTHEKPRFFQMEWSLSNDGPNETQVDLYYVGHSKSYNYIVNEVLNEFTLLAVKGMIKDVMSAMASD